MSNRRSFKGLNSVSARNSDLDEKKADLPPIHPDFLLNRNSILQEDRKKRIKNYTSQEVFNDVSYLLESTNFKVTHKRLSSEVLLKSFDKKLGPAGRIEIEQLSSWIAQMKETHLSELGESMKQGLIPSKELFEKAEGIYCIALTELVKQISTQSRQRGELVENVIETLKYIWTKYPDHLKELYSKEKEKLDKKIAEQETSFKFKISSLQLELNMLRGKCKKIENEKDLLSQELAYVKNQYKGYKKEVSLIVDSKQKKIVNQHTQTEFEVLDDYKAENKLNKMFAIKEVKNKNRVFLQVESCGDLALLPKLKPVLNKENMLNELRDLCKPYPELDLDQFVSSVLTQINNLNDWISGFKFSRDIQEKKENMQVKTLKTEQIAQSHNKKMKNSETTKDAKTIIQSVLKKSQNSLQKYSKITRRKVLKYINHSIYHSFSESFSETFTFSDMVLQEFINKYSIKLIAEKKFKELIAACLINMNESLKISLFASAIDCAGYFNNINYSTYGCEIYSKLYKGIILSRTGVIFDTGEPLDIEYYPITRALDVAKGLFSKSFSSERLSNLAQEIKSLAEVDLNHVNKDGMIKLDNFIEICMKKYEDFLPSIMEGVNFATEAITEMNYLTKEEVCILFKHLAPKKIHLTSKIKFDSNNEISSNDFKRLCVKYGVFPLDVILKFFEFSLKDSKIALKEVSDFEQSDVFMKEEKLSEEIISKVQDIKFNLKGKRSEKYFFMWHILKSELLQISN